MPTRPDLTRPLPTASCPRWLRSALAFAALFAALTPKPALAAAAPDGLESGLFSLEAGLLLAEERLFVECGDEWARLARTTAKRGDDAARVESGMQFALAARCYEWGEDMRAYKSWGQSIVQLARVGLRWEVVREELDRLHKRHRLRASRPGNAADAWTGEIVKRLRRSLSIREFAGPRPGLKATRQALPRSTDEDTGRRTPPRVRIHMPTPQERALGGFDVPEDEEGVMWLGEDSLGKTAIDAPAADLPTRPPARAERPEDLTGSRAKTRPRPATTQVESWRSVAPRARPDAAAVAPPAAAAPTDAAPVDDVWEPGETRLGL